jgi:hypothetical protein
MLVSGAIPSQHSHKIVKQLSAVMTFGFRWTSSHPRKLRIEIRNLLGGRPSPAIKGDSKQTTVELSTISTSTVGTKDSSMSPS